MSHQQPIFHDGLFGKANAFVCNSWQQSANAVSANAEGIEWAQRQVVAGISVRKFLAKITGATEISGATFRWTYSFEPFTIDGSASWLAETVDSSFGSASGGFDQAINFRELRNDDAYIDGSPTGGTIEAGPFGSRYENDAWTEELAGYCEMTVSHRSDGKVLFWFSEPNPVRCIPQSEFSP